MMIELNIISDIVTISKMIDKIEYDQNLEVYELITIGNDEENQKEFLMSEIIQEFQIYKNDVKIYLYDYCETEFEKPFCLIDGEGKHREKGQRIYNTIFNWDDWYSAK